MNASFLAHGADGGSESFCDDGGDFIESGLSEFFAIGACLDEFPSCAKEDDLTE